MRQTPVGAVGTLPSHHRSIGDPESYRRRLKAARKRRCGAASFLVLALGCASTPPSQPPAPVVRPAVSAAAEESDLSALIAGLADLPLRPIEASPPPLPYVPPQVEFQPEGPREGDAIGIYLTAHAPGATLTHVPAARGELAGRTVHFGHLGGGLFGIGAAPIGSAGPAELVVGYAAGDEWVEVRRLPLLVAARDFPSVELRVASRFSSPPDSELARIAREREEIRATVAVATPELYVSDAFRWPKPGRVTAAFGQRRVFNQELQSRHWGLDVSGVSGEPVRATARGRVALTGHFYFAGNSVFIDHGLGVYTGYFHLSKVLVAPGDFVERGQLIGEVGATGRVTAPHLHWSLYVDGESLDASSLFEIDIPPRSDPVGG